MSEGPSNLYNLSAIQAFTNSSSTIESEQHFEEVGDIEVDDAEANEETNNNDIVDVSDADPFGGFLKRIEDAKDGEALWEACQILPLGAKSTSKSMTINRIIKGMKLISALNIPPDFPTFGNWKKPHKKPQEHDETIFKARIFVVEDAMHVIAIKNVILAGFIDVMKRRNADGDKACSSNGNLVINRIALLAHLLVEPSLQSLLNQIHSTAAKSSSKTAVMDSTAGVTGTKNLLYNQVLSASEQLKKGYTNIVTEAGMQEYVGQEAYDHLKDIDPSKGTFLDGANLQQLETQFVNLHDELNERLLSPSGNNLPDGNAERAKSVWDSWIGQPGRNKNVGLFYCYLVWEKNAVSRPGFTRKLPSNKRVGSGIKINVEDNDADDDEVDSQKNKKGRGGKASKSFEKAMVSSLTKMADSFTNKIQNGPLTSPSGVSDVDLGDQRKIYYMEKAKSIETQRLSQFMESPHFNELIQTEQQKKAFQMKYAKLMGIEDIIAMGTD
jgi:hypothetical protein